MLDFESCGLEKVVIERGAFARVGELAAGLGRRAIVIYNGPTGVDRLVELLSGAGVSATARRQRGEPVVADVDSAVEEARAKKCDCMIGMGGGSAIDAAKAVAGLLTNGGSAVDYMEIVGEGRKITQRAAPWMAIPVTAGTGAEATCNAVIGFPEKKFKASVRSELLLARIALIDPELAVTVSPAVTASSGMDALCQLIESFTSSGASQETDAMALSGLRLGSLALPEVFRDGNDVDARYSMATAALMSGITLTRAGLGAVHGFAAPIGANFPVPHGTVCAALLSPVIAANIRACRVQGAAGNRGLLRYERIAMIFQGIGAIGDDAIDAAVKCTADLRRDLRIPPLKDFGLRASNVPEMVALARKTSSMKYNPVVLSDEALSDALLTAIDPGD
jgi:alcohol dehydrogenase class IV